MRFNRSIRKMAMSTPAQGLAVHWAGRPSVFTLLLLLNLRVKNQPMVLETVPRRPQHTSEKTNHSGPCAGGSFHPKLCGFSQDKQLLPGDSGWLEAMGRARSPARSHASSFISNTGPALGAACAHSVQSWTQGTALRGRLTTLNPAEP